MLVLSRHFLSEAVWNEATGLDYMYYELCAGYQVCVSVSVSVSVCLCVCEAGNDEQPAGDVPGRHRDYTHLHTCTLTLHGLTTALDTELLSDYSGAAVGSVLGSRALH